MPVNKLSFKISKKGKRLLIGLAVFLFLSVVGAVSFAAYCNHVVMSCSKYCYSDIEKFPFHETALLPGVAKIAPSGRLNQYFKGRTEAAAKLYHAGKIKHILISGDNSRKNYDEPTDIKNELISFGVPESALTLDYAGFRTLDSVVRAKNVFGKSRYAIITQPFHAERAVYLAREHGIEATAFYADEPLPYKYVLRRNRRREKLACIKAWLDINILHKTPKFVK